MRLTLCPDSIESWKELGWLEIYIYIYIYIFISFSTWNTYYRQDSALVAAVHMQMGSDVALASQTLV